MNSNIKSNVRKLTASDKVFFSKLQDANIPVIDLIQKYEQNKTEQVFFRSKDYCFAVTTLHCSRKNNLAVIGDSGVGKTAFVHYLAKYIPLILPSFALAEINIASLISGCAYRGEFEKKLTAVIELAISYNAIIYFDEAHALSMTGGSNTGGIDALNILKPHLTNDFRCVICTTSKESVALRKDVAFSRRFRFLELKPLSDDFKRKIVISKFGDTDIIRTYLNSNTIEKKELFEMIDDIDFLMSAEKIKEVDGEIYIK
ncbi:AAA family ATPase [Aeromonas veronii]|uniref:AAA family ATPase n=1 Tax=Aeromonas veronii TaxID=654 RepID=UPI001F299196|nr:AAA family ATPase [Aeromonas veronii]MCF5891992.1 AAA family ATPase [Aeromonas veronii]